MTSRRGFDLAQTPRVTFFFGIWRTQPGVDQSKKPGLVQIVPTHDKDVRTIVLPAQYRFLRRPAQSRTYAGEAVGIDRHANP
ncbi:MAG: hypothetical protein D6820_01585 [Lentisphaerae bacterium]|nr:MAG: hypothetical protein D6820_01585 [Lentisphaerota bacterium]